MHAATVAIGSSKKKFLAKKRKKFKSDTKLYCRFQIPMVIIIASSILSIILVFGRSLSACQVYLNYKFEPYMQGRSKCVDSPLLPKTSLEVKRKNTTTKRAIGTG